MSGVLLVLSYFFFPLIVLLGVVVQAAMPAGSQVVSKPLPWFKVKSNSRKRFDEADLRTLGKDLRVRQLQPLVCLSDGTIVCGERRYRAAVLEGLTDLMVMIITDPLTEAEFNRLQLVENLQRLDLSNAEKCIGCVNYAHSNPSLTFKQIGADLGVDASMVTRWMSWERCIDLVQQALVCDSITLQTLYSISQLPPERQEGALSEAVNGKKPGGNGDGNGNGQSPRSRNKLLLPSGVEFTVAATEMTLERLQSSLRDLLRLTEEAKDIHILCEAMKVAKSEGVTELDVLAKALKSAKELANDQKLDLRTLMTVAKGRKGKDKAKAG